MSAKYPAVGCKVGYFVDTDSFQVPRGRVVLFSGFSKGDGTKPDRTMSAFRVDVADSIGTLRARNPEAFRPMDQALQHDFDTLVSIRRHGGGLEDAMRVRRELAADTLAPAWLREYAAETVEMMRDELGMVRER